jgi:hypothetical protein
VSLELRQLYEIDDFEGISDAERAELARQMNAST